MIFRATRAFVGFIHTQKHGLNQAFGHFRGSDFHKMTGLDHQRPVDIHLQTFVNTGHNFERGRVVAFGFVHQHGCSRRENLGTHGALHVAAGHVEVVPRHNLSGLFIDLIPGLYWVRVSRYESPRHLHHNFWRGRNIVDKSPIFSVLHT